MADTKKKIGEEGELFATHIGGSATIEGVMMRGKVSWAVAVRSPDGIYVEEHDLPSKESQPAWWRWPLVRGCVSLVESMKLSLAAMNIASEHAWFPEDEVATQDEPVAVSEVTTPSPAAPAPEAALAAVPSPTPTTPAATVPSPTTPSPTQANTTATSSPEPNTQADTQPNAQLSPQPEGGLNLSPWEFITSIGLGLVLGVALFMALPVFLSNLIVGELTPDNSILWNLVEALVRIVLLVIYVWAIRFYPDMARVFGYHGAEHLTIHCFEHGEELTPANCAKYSRIHVRCGTAFLVMTVFVAILVNSVVPVAALADTWGITGIARNLFVFCSRLLLLPIVAGLSYEVTVKWAGTHPNNPLVKVALWPGLKMQLLTTAEPDEGMLECAIAALKRVDEREKLES